MSVDIDPTLDSSCHHDASSRRRLVRQARSFSTESPQQCGQGPVMVNTSYGDSRNSLNRRISKLRPTHRVVSSDLSDTHYSYPSMDTGRSSQSYLAGSHNTMMLELTERKYEQVVHDAPVLGSDQILQQSNLAARRNKSVPQLCSPSLSHWPVRPPPTSPVFSNVSASTRIPKSQSVLFRNTKSPASPHAIRRYSMETQEKGRASAALSFTRLDFLPVSPLNPNFLDSHLGASSPVRENGQIDTRGNSRSSVDFSTSAVCEETADTTPYIPMRRRSIIQTPGLATRPSAQAIHSAVLKSSATTTTSIASVLSSSAETANTHSKAKNKKKQKERQKKMHGALPSLPTGVEQERSSTPSDFDYQQLGGIKFGTLRITNASPVPSSHQESDDEKEIQPAAHARPVFDSLGPRSSAGATHLSIVDLGQSMETSVNDDDNSLMPRKIIRKSEDSDDDGPMMEKSGQDGTSREISNSVAECCNDLKLLPSRSSDDTTPEDLSELELGQKARPKDEISMEYPSNEVLDVRNDPNAKALLYKPDNIKGQPSASSSNVSDSGFASTGSSRSSRRTLSNADSGYGSNTSIQSKLHMVSKGEGPQELTIQDKVNPGDNKVQAAVNSLSLPETQDNELGDITRKSFVSISSNSARRISSRLRHCRSVISAEVKDRPGKLLRRRSEDYTNGPPVSIAFNETQIAAQGDCKGKTGVEKTSRYQRWFRRSRKKGLPNGFAAHDTAETVPTVPLDVEKRLQQHNTNFPTASRRLTKLFAPSEQSLKTIISVESSVETSSCVGESGESQRRSYHESIRLSGSFISQRSLDTTESTEMDVYSSRSEAMSTAKVSQTFESLTGATHKQNVIRKHVSQVEDQSISAETFLSGQYQKATQVKIFSAAAPRNANRSAGDHDGGERRFARRASASDLDLRSAGAFDDDENPGTNLLGLLGFLKEAPQERAHHFVPQSAFSRQRSRQSHGAEENWSTASKGDQQRPARMTVQGHIASAQRRDPPSQHDGWAWLLRRRHSTLVNRPVFPEEDADAPMTRATAHPEPPYRVLHSYNSPAYKNLPIWG